MEEKILEIINEILVLENENIEIKEKLNRLTIDLDCYQIKRASDNYGDDRLNATIITNILVIGLIAALCKKNNFTPWETNEIIGFVISLIGDAILSCCLLRSYFKEKKKNPTKEIIDYSKLIKDVREEIETLRKTQTSNLDKISRLNDLLLGFKEFIADLCVQKMAENNTECDQNIIKKSIGTYTGRR